MAKNTNLGDEVMLSKILNQPLSDEVVRQWLVTTEFPVYKINDFQIVIPVDWLYCF